MGLQEDLLDVRDQLVKARGEIVTKIEDLEAAVSNSGEVSPEVAEALSEVKAAAQALDDIVPDAVVEDTPVDEPPVEDTNYNPPVIDEPPVEDTNV